MKKATMPTIRISVSHTRKQWFLNPPKSIEREFKEKHKFGFCVYSIKGGEERLIRTIKEATKMILSKGKTRTRGGDKGILEK